MQYFDVLNNIFIFLIKLINLEEIQIFTLGITDELQNL